MDREKLQEALLHPKDKAGKKYLMQAAEELKETDRETYDSILRCKSWTGDFAKAARRCRLASAGNTVAVILALCIVVASFILGDFGMAVFTGWLNRYLLAIGIVAAVGLVSLGTWISTRQKSILIAMALCKEEQNRTAP